MRFFAVTMGMAPFTRSQYLPSKGRFGGGGYTMGLGEGDGGGKGGGLGQRT